MSGPLTKPKLQAHMITAQPQQVGARPRATLTVATVAMSEPVNFAERVRHLLMEADCNHSTQWVETDDLWDWFDGETPTLLQVNAAGRNQARYFFAHDDRYAQDHVMMQLWLPDGTVRFQQRYAEDTRWYPPRELNPLDQTARAVLEQWVGFEQRTTPVVHWTHRRVPA
jgi:hypothetical protein